MSNRKYNRKNQSLRSEIARHLEEIARLKAILSLNGWGDKPRPDKPSQMSAAHFANECARQEQLVREYQARLEQYASRLSLSWPQL